MGMDVDEKQAAAKTEYNTKRNKAIRQGAKVSKDESHRIQKGYRICGSRVRL
jgi:hypothetical protein